MTTLEKIGIQGIRSYGDEEAQELEFASPITVIYGNNGSGKSTIIECLKVSCTGDFPPNAEKGKSFIHDPLVSNKMNIRGKINLLLKNYNNKRVGISRSFNLFYCKDKNKKIKHTFRALDNNIIIKKGKGQEDVIITNKCVDINNHIPKLMGVSKALLENVILCHHEESLWPFSESVKIKKKFDELFGDDNFSKILDELIKCKKTMNDMLKRKEYELGTLKDFYEKKNNITLEIQKNEKEIENSETLMQLHKEEIDQSLNMLQKLKKNNSILSKLISHMDMYFVLYEKFQFDMENYKNMKEIYEEDSKELQQYAELLQKDLIRCETLIENVHLDIVELEKQSNLDVYSCDEFDIKERDVIQESLSQLERRKTNLKNLTKLIFDIDSSTFSMLKRRNIKRKMLSEEYIQLCHFMKSNEPIFVYELEKWRFVFSKKPPNFKFNVGYERSSHSSRIAKDEKNQGENSRGDITSLLHSRTLDEGEITNETSISDNLTNMFLIMEVRKMVRKHVHKLALIRTEVYENIRERKKILKKKKNLIRKLEKWKRRNSKVDKKIAKMKRYQEKLTQLKWKDKLYESNINNLEKMNQIGCIYDSIELSELNFNLIEMGCDIHTYTDNGIERKKEQLKKIQNLKKKLEKMFHIATSFNTTYKHFLIIQSMNMNIISFFHEQWALFSELAKFSEIYNSIRVDNSDLYAYIENLVLYSDVTNSGLVEEKHEGYKWCSDALAGVLWTKGERAIEKVTSEGARGEGKMGEGEIDEREINENEIDENEIDENEIDENEIDENEIDENEIDEREIDENEIDEREINENEIDEANGGDMPKGNEIRVSIVHNQVGEITKRDKIAKLKKCTSLENPCEVNSSKCEYKEYPKRIVNIKNKKRMNEFRDESCCSRLKRKKKIIEFFPQYGKNKNYMKILNDLLNVYVNKYEKKTNNIESKTLKLKEKLILICRELDIVNNQTEKYPEVLSQFRRMLEKINFKNMNDFINHFCHFKINIKKIKMDLITLRSKEESLKFFLQDAQNLNSCHFCKSSISTSELSSFSILNAEKQREEINQELEEKQKLLTNLKSEKKEMKNLLVYYYHNVEPICRDNNVLSDYLHFMKNELVNVQNGIHNCSMKINNINENYELLMRLKKRCNHLVERETNVISMQQQLYARHRKVKLALRNYRDIFSQGKECVQFFRSFLDELEVGTAEVEAAEVVAAQVEDVGLIMEVKQFLLKSLPQYINLYDNKEIMNFFFQKVSEHVESHLVRQFIEHESNDIVEEESENHVMKKNKKYVDAFENSNLDEVGKTLTSQTECDSTIENSRDTSSHDEGEEDLIMRYSKSHLEGSLLENKDLLSNCTNGGEKSIILIKNLHAEWVKEKTIKRSEKCESIIMNNINVMHMLKSVNLKNKEFLSLYDKLLLCINLEEMKKKQEIDMIHRMKSVIKDRKEYVKKKIDELQNNLEREKQIRESINKSEKYIAYYLGKKICIQKKEETILTLMKRVQLEEKNMRRNIRRKRNDILFLNKLYYIKINIIKQLNNLLTEINTEKEVKGNQLRRVIEKIQNNQVIKNESNELVNKINKKKEQILCLQEEKINIEKMHHNVVMNTNLKKMHENFLNHQKNFISSLNEFKNTFFLHDKQEKQLNEINSMIKQLDEMYETDCDIYKFINESFTFLNYKNELLELAYREEDNLREKIERHTKSVTDLKMKEAEMKGKIELRKEYVEKLISDRNSDSYTNIEKKYKKKIIEIFVYKNVIKDICNFYNSFDQAIIKFHSLKMQEINISIKNLWRRVYNSADIDYIYIKSDIQTENNGKIQQRRSYNYRVVMVKDNCELDMKGRCSSGQKVLSSIIIRLALAESFSIKCGILALDEPTTNLDKSNSKNLASLIANIVDIRKESSSFQLILITHDTYFVDILSQYGLTNCFYKIRKDNMGYSKIIKIRN
ncbi:DNA repair protein RAD50 [Plasmodium gonderi]|uniref:DNA repair protein RAD50 n=1 Tax=Plasmodium gonderi TaxID=77519 RepID=A0A1Y1JMA6_PLAGO|nr:DNA repair protein RAD50 [Plasmodium gonderi]GAW81962.1 DNA repair protein RAD50 [Plasmodium gonderi]